MVEQLHVDFFVNMMLLLSMNSLLFVNIKMSSCPSPRFHMILMPIFTCCHTWHATLLTITMNSITMEVLMVLMFM
jgi:hypothetical protein